MKTIFVFLLLPFIFFSQRQNNLSKSELGIFTGGSYYIGDLNPLQHFKNSHIAYGIIAKYNINPRFALRGLFMMGNVSANDAQSPSQYNKLQNSKTQFVKHGENKQPSFQRVPANSRLIAVGDKRYFDCDHCGSFHKVGKVCYFVQSAQIAAHEEQSGN